MVTAQPVIVALPVGQRVSIKLDNWSYLPKASAGQATIIAHEGSGAICKLDDVEGRKSQFLVYSVDMVDVEII